MATLPGCSSESDVYDCSDLDLAKAPSSAGAGPTESKRISMQNVQRGHLRVAVSCRSFLWHGESMPTDLPEKYRLSFLVGEIVRNDVFAETEMRTFFYKLNDAGLINELHQQNLGRLVSQVRKALNKNDVPVEFRKLALEVVEGLAVQHRLRSSLAHDQWMHLPKVRPDKVRSMRRPGTIQPISELEACATELIRLAWRIRGLWIIAPYWLNGDLSDHTSPEDLHSWTRVAMGHIADDPSMTRGTDGEAPHPPGGFPPAID